MKKIIILLSFLTNFSPIFGAFLRSVPQTLTQPNGSVINCFATGDEYYNWLHDANSYTIIQNKSTGYYCYAILQNSQLIASQYVVGVSNPAQVGLTPNINISTSQVSAIRDKFNLAFPQMVLITSTGGNAGGGSNFRVEQTMNNLVIFIRFSDQTEFPADRANYNLKFNGANSTDNSVYNYYREVSYNSFTLNSLLLPTATGSNVVSYQDSHARGYFLPSVTGTNPNGYTDANRYQREFTLLHDAVLFVRNQIPTTTGLDFNNDGRVDNISFIIRGATDSWGASILWPHRLSQNIYPTYGSYTDRINGKIVQDYNVLIESYNTTGVICHELFHTLGAPDLYRFPGNSNVVEPVSIWDVMAGTQDPPQHMSAYMKSRFGKWIDNIPIISVSGTYTLNPLDNSTNNCYRIPSPKATEYFVVEYRKKAGFFENQLPNSGLIIYKVNTSASGNSVGPPDEVYVYRPDGTLTINGIINNATFSKNTGRTEFGNSSNPKAFMSDGTLGNIYIKNITEASNTISFDLRFCDGNNVIYTNTSTLPSITNSSNSITTNGSVIVKNTDKVVFEAPQDITLNGGFEIQAGGEFEINMNGCATR